VAGSAGLPGGERRERPALANDRGARQVCVVRVGKKRICPARKEEIKESYGNGKKGLYTQEGGSTLSGILETSYKV